MKAYLDLLAEIMVRGDVVPTGATLTSEGRKPTARSLFAAQFRHDLARGFPAVTTKRLFFDSVVKEVLWFLRGETSVKTLGCKIWDSWADPQTGECGPIYGHVWRRFGAKPFAIAQPKPRLRAGVEGTYLGIANGSGKEGHILAKTWQGLIERCYSPQQNSYGAYGGRGVFVCDRWLEFAAFAEDAVNLPGWVGKEREPEAYELDKDGLGDGFEYSPTTCQWVTRVVNASLRAERLYVVRQIDTGQVYEFLNITEFCDEQGFSSKNFSDLWTGNKNAKVRNGFELVEVRDLNAGVDQIAQIVEDLKAVAADPSNRARRRIILNGWDLKNLPRMGLPPCHTVAQWLPVNGRLNCHCFWRSIDTPVGMPFNIAQYALLTHMFAAVAGLEPGELVASVTDLHIYDNQYDMVREQLARTPHAHPRLRLPDLARLAPDLTINQVAALTPDMFGLDGYECWPPLKCEVAV